MARRAVAPTVTAAVLSLGAGYVHLAYMTSHWQEWWAYGAFFLAAAAGQGLFAVLVLRSRSAWLLLAGIAGNVAVVGLYVLTRTSGPPLGPRAGAIEPAGAVDLLTTAAEIAIVVALLAVLGPRARARVVNLLLVAGALLWALRATGHLA
jgi:hypothetical protein